MIKLIVEVDTENREELKKLSQVVSVLLGEQVKMVAAGPVVEAETKICALCGNAYARGNRTVENFARSRFCSRSCALKGRQRDGHPWMKPKTVKEKLAAGEPQANILENGEWKINPERDGHGKTKYCQKCGMYIWKTYDGRRSKINPDYCDSCGKDPVREDEFSTLQSVESAVSPRFELG